MKRRRQRSVRGQALYRPGTGQVAIILLLVIAMGLVFYAASMNLGGLSQTKLLTTMASNIGAAQLASSMASYGQYISETMLKGQEKKCKFGGVLGQIITWVIVSLTAIAAMIITGGATMVVVLSVVSMALSTASVVVQVTVIEPGFVRSWNSMMTDTTDTEGSMVEQALRTGLQNSVTDNVKVPDITDSDLDMVWGFENNKPKDTLSRFAEYYTSRLKTLLKRDDHAIRDFLIALEEFMYFGTDGWGLHDPLTSCYSDGSIALSECNPCCVPPEVRSDCCDIGVGQCGTAATCGAQSPYFDFGKEEPFYQYRYVYDFVFENAFNDLYSFRELIGRDDAHRYYSKNPDKPNEVPQRLTLVPVPGTGFHLDDTTGFYVDPPYARSPPDKNDTKKGIFPFFYKIADWGVDLTALDKTPTHSVHPQHCYWYDTVFYRDCDPFRADLPQELKLKPLSLIYNPDPNFGDIQYNIHPYVDSTEDNITGNPALAPDRIVVPGNILADPTECAQTAFDPGAVDIGFWKRGDDRFCSEGDHPADPDKVTWPYAFECDKYDSDGHCDSTDAASWPDDVLDDLHNELGQFILLARDGLIWGNFDNLVKTFTTWYDEELAQWIEPNDQGGCAVLCNAPQKGRLYVLRDKMHGMLDRLTAFRDSSYAGLTCNQVWCVPPAQLSPNEYGINECPGVTVGEAATFGGGATLGDMADVIACLNWNINDPVPGFPAEYGNSAKFHKCLEKCVEFMTSHGSSGCPEANATCGQLPRSLVPGFDSYVYVPCVTGYIGGTESCSDGLPNGFRQNVSQSIIEAANQVAKFEQRRDFLDKRLQEVTQIIDILEDAAGAFDTFLEDAAALVVARRDFSTADFILPNLVIYGWQDEPQPDELRGSWHIVRLDAAIPGRCAGACNVDQDPLIGDPQLPKVCVDQGFTENCYSLCETDGVIKYRATRWDENRDAPELLFSLPNSGRGDVPQTYIGALDEHCPYMQIPDHPGDPPEDSTIYKGAFILNSWEQFHGDTHKEGCWNAATKILPYGVSTATCAKYYYHGEGVPEHQGMSFNFVPCENW